MTELFRRAEPVRLEIEVPLIRNLLRSPVVEWGT